MLLVLDEERYSPGRSIRNSRIRAANLDSANAVDKVIFAAAPR